MENTMYKILLTLAVLSGSVCTFAQDDWREGRVTGAYPEMTSETATNYKWNMGLISGVNSPKGDTSSSAEYGVTAGFEPTKNIGLGMDATSALLNDKDQHQRTIVQAKADYVIGGDIPVLRTSYVGVGGGPIFIDNKVRWGYSPLVGFDVPLSNSAHDYMSLGVVAKYLLNPDTPNSLSAGAAVKYWF